MDALNAKSRIEFSGISVDRTLLHNMTIEYEKEVEETRVKIAEMVKEWFAKDIQMLEKTISTEQGRLDLVKEELKPYRSTKKRNAEKPMFDALKIRKMEHEKNLHNLHKIYDPMVDYNPNSYEHNQKVFSRLTGKNVVATDEDFIQSCLDSPRTKAPVKEFFKSVLQYREKQHILSTFLVGIDKRIINGRIHANFNLHRTVTGRLSSSDPNLQRFRSSFVRYTFLIFTTSSSSSLIIIN
jgi:DNA polymerase I-like protein with 3'-5' exonuclease and polymerase domains